MTRGVYDVTCILTCPVAGYNMLYAKGRMPPLRAAHAKIIMEEYCMDTKKWRKRLAASRHGMLRGGVLSRRVRRQGQ